MPRISAGEESFALWMRQIGMPDPVREYVFAPPRKWRFDFAWPDHFFAVEIEGITYFGPGIGRHQTRKGFELDSEKYEAAMVRGWTVYRVPSTWVYDNGKTIWRKETEVAIRRMLRMGDSWLKNSPATSARGIS